MLSKKEVESKWCELHTKREKLQREPLPEDHKLKLLSAYNELLAEYSSLWFSKSPQQPPPPPPLPNKDINDMRGHVKWVEKFTEESSLRDDHGFPLLLTGGRNHSERLDPRPLNNYVRVVLKGFIKIGSFADFLDSLGVSIDRANEVCKEVVGGITPYSLASVLGPNVVAAGRGESVLYNRKSNTIFKFLGSKKSVGRFLTSVHIASKYSEFFGCARCVTYYPNLMCAEYEYAGENLQTLLPNISRPEELTRIQSRIKEIVLDFFRYGDVKPTKLDYRNFCMNPETGEIKMTCMEWFEAVFP